MDCGGGVAILMVLGERVINLDFFCCCLLNHHLLSSYLFPLQAGWNRKRFYIIYWFLVTSLEKFVSNFYDELHLT